MKQPYFSIVLFKTWIEPVALELFEGQKCGLRRGLFHIFRHTVFPLFANENKRFYAYC